MFCLIHDGASYQEVSCDTPESWVVMTHVELAQHSPFYMDIESAVAIGGALLMVMVVAFVLRQITNYLRSKDEEE
jgi:hypothetical protein